MAGPKAKNTLSIRLAEGAVFLRNDDPSGRDRHHTSRPSLVRGLLTLDLVKPTRISSIEVALAARTYMAWPEGVGARTMEVTEEHQIFNQTSYLFRAGAPSRRALSIGPGSFAEALFPDDPDDDEALSSRPSTAQDRPNHMRRHTSNLHTQRRLSSDELPGRSQSGLDPPLPTYLEATIDTPTQSPTLSPILSPTQGTGHVTSTFDLSSPTRRHESRGRTILSSPSSIFHRDLPLSRRPSIEDVPEENEAGPSSPRQSALPLSPGIESPDGRGRKKSKFRLSAVLLDAVRPSTPSTSETGRSGSKGKSVDRTQKRKSGLGKIGELLRLDDDPKQKDGENWKEFRKGSYTYPISFVIPGNAPPTLQCNFGSVTWRVKATVHRPGAFKSRMVASREVIVVAGPTEDEIEDSDQINVERVWDDQLQYHISISGRSFHIGGVIPVTFSLMPLAKIKVHQIAVLLEEQVDYYTQFKKIVRSEPVIRMILLSLKHEDKFVGAILPLDTDFDTSPWPAVIGSDNSETASEEACSLMGPGPWTFHKDLQLPSTCRLLHFTNKNKRSGMTVTHHLKCIMRVERGDDSVMDEKTGKRKLFDIVMQVPVHILSCRCNPDWMSLPHYAESFHDPGPTAQQCPCTQRRFNLNQPSEHQPSLARAATTSSDSGNSTGEIQHARTPRPQTVATDDSLRARNTHFERLVSGQETELGEEPPSYTTAVAVRASA